MQKRPSKEFCKNGKPIPKKIEGLPPVKGCGACSCKADKKKDAPKA